jgi:H+-transporting ATPase
LIGTLATQGVLMTALPVVILGSVIAAAAGFALLLDTVKVAVFRRLAIA